MLQSQGWEGDGEEPGRERSPWTADEGEQFSEVKSWMRWHRRKFQAPICSTTGKLGVWTRVGAEYVEDEIRPLE